MSKWVSRIAAIGAVIACFALNWDLMVGTVWSSRWGGRRGGGSILPILGALLVIYPESIEWLRMNRWRQFDSRDYPKGLVIGLGWFILLLSLVLALVLKP
jgi:hypothetical protein